MILLWKWIGNQGFLVVMKSGVTGRKQRINPRTSLNSYPFTSRSSCLMMTLVIAPKNKMTEIQEKKKSNNSGFISFSNIA